MERHPRTVAIFDFDCTVVDVDSDPWVAQQLGATPLFQSLQTHLSWNDAMDVLMLSLQKKGWTVEDVQKALCTIPIKLEIIDAIKEAYVRGCELRIVSDANTFFIKTILQKHGIGDLFTRIHTNPSFIDGGRIHIAPYHSKQWEPHGCSLCPPNMCKGMILEEIKHEIQKCADSKWRVVYLGDGNGDFCPALRLGLGDYVFPRKGYPLSDLITENIQMVKAKVCPWSDGREMEEKLVALLTPDNSISQE